MVTDGSTGLPFADPRAVILVRLGLIHQTDLLEHAARVAYDYGRRCSLLGAPDEGVAVAMARDMRMGAIEVANTLLAGLGQEPIDEDELRRADAATDAHISTTQELQL